MSRADRSPASIRLDALLHPSPAETTDFADPFLAGDADRPTLVDVLDRLLDRGVVIHGDLKISVADVDLLYVGLSVVAASVDAIEDAKQAMREAQEERDAQEERNAQDRPREASQTDPQPAPSDGPPPGAAP